MKCNPTLGDYAGVVTVEPGGQSNCSAEPSICPADTPESAEPAVLNVEPLDAWRFDDASLGYRVCREIARGDLRICLSVGRSGDNGPIRFSVPLDAIVWLLTGEF